MTTSPDTTASPRQSVADNFLSEKRQQPESRQRPKDSPTPAGRPRSETPQPAAEMPLPDAIPTPFVLLDAVIAFGPDELVATRSFTAAPTGGQTGQTAEGQTWLALEAAAQAAALHQRWLADFSRHAFLLSVESCRFSDSLLLDTTPTDAIGHAPEEYAPEGDAPNEHTAAPLMTKRHGRDEHADEHAKDAIDGHKPANATRMINTTCEARAADTALIRAQRLGQSSGAASYLVSILFPAPETDTPAQRNQPNPTNRRGRPNTEQDTEPKRGRVWSVRLTIGSVPYNATFKQDLLESRYRELFQCLTHNSPCAPASKTD